jgi:hypothetical protein
MFLAIVVAVVVGIVGAAIYQWVRPPNGKPIDQRKQIARSEGYNSVQQGARIQQYLPPGSS